MSIVIPWGVEPHGRTAIGWHSSSDCPGSYAGRRFPPCNPLPLPDVLYSSLNEALNLTTFFSGISMIVPALMLRAFRAARNLMVKEPKPREKTSSPDWRVSVITSRSTLRTCSTVCLSTPEIEAILLANSCFVILLDRLPVHREVFKLLFIKLFKTLTDCFRNSYRFPFCDRIHKHIEKAVLMQGQCEDVILAFFIS